jgi:hypothetical protein
MTLLFSGAFSGIGLLWDRQLGFLKETLVAPVPRIQIMLGRTLGSATVAVIPLRIAAGSDSVGRDERAVARPRCLLFLADPTLGALRGTSSPHDSHIGALRTDMRRGSG